MVSKYHVRFIDGVLPGRVIILPVFNNRTYEAQVFSGCVNPHLVRRLDVNDDSRNEDDGSRSG